MKKLGVATLSFCIIAACSSDKPERSEGDDSFAPVHVPRAGDDFVGGDDVLGSSSGDDGATGNDTCAPPDDPSSCVGETYAGESIPLDIYIMFDQSGSMCSCIDPAGGQACPDPACNQTRLDAVREATDQFLRDPDSAGIGVGIGYFGKQPIGQASCDVADYTSAAVEIGTLPGHADAIMSSLDGIEPTGETPTGAAIRGACDYARVRKDSHPDHQVVILLLTDGKPEAPVSCQNGAGTCCPSLGDAVQAATECLDGPGNIKTYVLGVGPLLDNLQEIAAAGGTGAAYLVEGGNVSDEVLAALNRIRGDAAIPCQLALPPPPQGRELEYDEVNLKYANSACESTFFYSVQSEAECGSEDGWYYDDPTSPTSIRLCPASCDRVSGPGGTLYYSVGCATEFRIR